MFSCQVTTNIIIPVCSRSKKTSPIQHISLTRARSLPFMVRLPRRYEIYNQQPPTRRRSLQTEFGHVSLRELERRRPSLQLNPVSEDMDIRTQDLNQAIQWITQELIFLRQHDVLLRRQFQQIRKTLTTLRTRRENPSSSSDKTSTDYSGESPDIDEDDSSIQSCMYRSASSFTSLNDSDSEDSDEFRYRSCSSITSRDLASAVRRRESKEAFV